MYLIFLLVALGCHRSGGSEPAAEPVAKESVDCEDTDEIRYKWDWCNKNEIENSLITQVCYGKVFYLDMIFDSVKLERTSTSKSCFFNTGALSNLSLSGCASSIRRAYSSINEQAVEIQVDECYGASQELNMLAGQIDSQQSFRSSRP
jgi:hypothetical protein